MKKTGLYFFIIALMLLLVNLLNFGVAPKDKVIMAYYGAPGTQGLVNTFDTIYLAGEPTPPSGRDLDVWKWASQSVSPTPTPQMSDYGPFALLDTNGPIGGNGNSFARVSWIAQAQYISLEQRYFENVGGPAGVSTESQDWRAYDYITFNFYQNRSVNLIPPTTADYQIASICDGGVTFTTSAACMTCTTEVSGKYGYAILIESETNQKWTYHVTMSLNFLRNYYDETAGRYFDAQSITRFVVNAPITNYALWTNNTFVMYYDYLTLGAGVKAYTAPDGVTITASYYGMDMNKVRNDIDWNQTTFNVQAGRPVTAYHIYRDDTGTGTGPYRHVGYQAATTTAYADLSVVTGNQTYCYKILTCDNGPGQIAGTSAADQITNTINATYNEALLNSATAYCVFVPAIPTPTNTPLATETPCTGICNTPTITPTTTITPTVVITAAPTATDINDAHVWPNPFNPDMTAYKFKVGNVPADTQITIYSMAGELVKDGKVNTSNNNIFEWDGRNKSGSKVVTGLYYLVLKSPQGKTKTLRIIICYKCDPVYKP